MVSLRLALMRLHSFLLPWSTVGFTMSVSLRYCSDDGDGPFPSDLILVLSYEYSKQPILGLTQECFFRELSLSRLECGVHDELHISSAGWWDLLLPLA